MSVASTEKSPIDREVYEGLQVDTRKKDSVNTRTSALRGRQDLQDQYDSDHEENHLSEKQAIVQQPQDYASSTSSASSAGRAVVDRGTSIVVLPNESAKSGSMPKVRRVCGVRRRNFWVIFGLVLTTVIAAAVIGGTVGGTRHSNSTSDNGNIFHADVIIGSPLTVLSYPGTQKLAMYFQSAAGDIKESVTNDDGLTWQPAKPIFTDAINNTGLASITYWDAHRSVQNASIFYVDNRGHLREKRNNHTTDIWDLAPRDPSPISPRNHLLHKNDGEPENGWDVYRMTAVYSKNFAFGAGCRLFYHSNNSSVVQELIWNNETWSKGASFDAYPKSHLSATIDESTKILRLFYSTGGRALQYSWLDITRKDAKYKKGPSLGNYLIHSSADIAAISDNGTTYVYHYAAPVPPKHRELSITTPPGISIQDNSTGAQGIHELKISGPPGAEVFSLSGPILSSPKLESPYQPLTASKSSPKNTTDAQIHLFWTEKMNGSTNFAFAVSNNNSGYSQLWEVSRRLKEGSGWLIKREIPLGTED